MKKIYKRAVALGSVLAMLAGIIGARELIKSEKVQAATMISTTEDARLLGIDVSKYQGTIDWEAVKEDGVDYAIIRCGVGQDLVSQDDAYYDKNTKACEKQGIPYGVYIYSYANTTKAAIGEANHVLRLLKGKNLSYPVYYDMEDNKILKDPDGNTNSKKTIGKIAKAFADTIEAAGYEVGIYSGYSYANTNLTDPVFDNYDRWIARYNSYCKYGKSYNMWQFSSKGSVDGISGAVDMDYTIGTEVITEVKGISLDVTQCELQVGETQKLTATIMPLNALEKGVNWTTSDAAVVSVKSGTLSALKCGTVTITATSKENGTVLATCDVTVAGGIEPTPAAEAEVTSSPIVITPNPNAGTATGGAATIAPTERVESTNTPRVTATVNPTGTPDAIESEGPTNTEVAIETVAPIITPAATETQKPMYSPDVTKSPEPTATLPVTEIEVTESPEISPTPSVVAVGTVKELTYKAVTKASIKLTWKKVSGCDGYRVYYYNTEEEKYKSVATVKKSSAVEYFVEKTGGVTLKAGTKYKFKVKAYREVAGTKYFGIGKTVKAITKPAATKITKVSRISNTKARIKWSKNTTADGYVIYMSTKKNGTYKEVASITDNKTISYTIKKLKKGTAYYVRVVPYVKYESKMWFGNYTSTKTISKSK